MFVCLFFFLFCLWPQLTDEDVITSRFISLKDARRAICGFHQSIFFKSCDCRGEGVVPANTNIEKVG